MSNPSNAKINRVEIEVPTYLLMTDEALQAKDVDYKGQSTLTILDGHKENRLDLGKDKVLLNGTELTMAQQKEIFRRLGIDKPQAMVLDFAQAYFGSLDRISDRVANGKYASIDEVDDALTPDDAKAYAKFRAYTGYAGINRPTASRARIKDAAYQVANRKAQALATREARLKKAWKECRILYFNNDTEYWAASKRLREAYLKYDKKTEIDALFKLDQKAYAKPVLRAAIPEATKKYLAQIGKIKVSPQG